MVPLELQAGHPASRYRLSLAQCPSLASSRFALNTSITRQADILDRHTLAEATRNTAINGMPDVIERSSRSCSLSYGFGSTFHAFCSSLGTSFVTSEPERYLSFAEA